MVCSGNTCVVTAKAPSLTSRPDGLVEAVEAHGDFFRCTAQLDRSAAASLAAAVARRTERPSEDDLSVPFMRVTRILEVRRAPTDRRLNWDDRLENLRGSGNVG
jgi:hypothetical protein